MGILDVILGRDQNGNVSKINLALIALMLWKMYQSSKGGAAPQPMPAPSGRGGDMPAPSPRTQAPLPAPDSIASDGGFRDLTDAMNRMPDDRREPGSGGMGGGLGDILGDILGGGRPRGGQPEPGGMPGGGLGDILGDILGGGRPSGRGGQPGGGLGEILGDILGGGRAPGGARAVSGAQGDPFAELLRGAGGAGLGGLLGAGLGGLLQQFQESGHGAEAQSWVARGDNRTISPADVEDTFGRDTIDTLAQQLGIPRNELLSGLAQVLPQAVDQMTPEGRLPTPDEAARWV